MGPIHNRHRNKDRVSTTMAGPVVNSLGSLQVHATRMDFRLDRREVPVKEARAYLNEFNKVLSVNETTNNLTLMPSACPRLPSML